jgi:hypothetical protein
MAVGLPWREISHACGFLCCLPTKLVGQVDCSEMTAHALASTPRIEQGNITHSRFTVV